MTHGRDWIQDKSSRGCDFKYSKGKHVSLPELKKDHPNHSYLTKKNIPCYPKFVFNVSKVCHVTEINGLKGIFEDKGFRGNDSFLWWDLSVSDDDIANAENSLAWQRPNQMESLKKFTTSPAFQNESRYGNFRFTFNLKHLLHIYSKTFCGRTAPILRVLDTRIYKKEIVYSVLVHPRYMTHYRKYPRLPIDDKSLCGYREGKMSWHCQSPSDNYKYSLEVDAEDGEVYPRPLERTEFFVWDHVAVAFHMKRGWVLPVDRRLLVDNLSVCEVSSKELLKEPKMFVYEAEDEADHLKKIYGL